jgi:hypothetical protein
MFDSLTCKYPLPLTPRIEYLSSDWSKVVFQTKDLDNSLSYYEIREDGHLYQEVIEREYIPYTEEELKTLKPKPWSPFKEVIVKNKNISKVDYHGKINFYESLEFSEDEDMWVEFVAYFVYGKLDKLELFHTSKSTSAALGNKRLEERLLQLKKSKWYRFKRMVGPYGWNLFWKSLAKLITKIAGALSHLQLAIYKRML